MPKLYLLETHTVATCYVLLIQRSTSTTVVLGLYSSVCSICWAWMMHVHIMHAYTINRKSSWKRHCRSSSAHRPLVGTLFTCISTLCASYRVRYPELRGCPLFGCCYCTIYMETSVGTYGSVRYSVDVRYRECPLMESPLYIGQQFSRSND